MKLTNSHRTTIVKDLLKHRFSEEYAALVRDRAEFAGKVYDDCFRKADRERMAALPEGWLPTMTSVTASFGGHVHELPFDGASWGDLRSLMPSGGDKVFRRVPYSKKSAVLKVYTPDHDLTARALALHHREEDLKKRHGDAAKNAHAVLNSVVTLKQLVDAWPEVRPFCGSIRLQSPVKLPAVRVSTLNAIFKLPVAA